MPPIIFALALALLLGSAEAGCAAPATAPDFGRTWAAAPAGGQGPITITQPKGAWVRYVFTPRKSIFKGFACLVTYLPHGRGTVSEALAGGWETLAAHYVFNGNMVSPGPDDGPVYHRVRYDLRFDTRRGRLAGTRQVTGEASQPIELAPALGMTGE
jgi:hypothetical protein